MCQICSDWEKQKMTSKEAFRAINEVINSTKDPSKVEHLMDLSNRIVDKEVPTTEPDPDADANWWKSTHEED